MARRSRKTHLPAAVKKAHSSAAGREILRPENRREINGGSLFSRRHPGCMGEQERSPVPTSPRFFIQRAMKYTGYCCRIRFLNGKIIQIVNKLDDFVDCKICFLKLRISVLGLFVFDTGTIFCIIAVFMSEKARVLSPAKVNLHLEIFSKRGDGFHTLLSVFQMISLYDEIEIRSLTTEDVCEIAGDFPFPPHKNIIWTCCRIFREKTGVKRGLSFTVKKRIPQGAGLGGGSSNGASVLRALNGMFGTGLSAVELSALGAEAGSDVPFFCRCPAALVSGRGELIEGLDPRTDFFLVLVVPPLRVNTAAAYGWLDAARRPGQPALSSPAAGSREYLKNMYEGESPENWRFFNSFYPVLKEREPVFDHIRRRLLDGGALYANLSGSGSAMFGVFGDKNTALRCRQSIADDYPDTEFLSPLAGMPELILQ
jgi:4-diphosphocytidyl-2-C-methyl-D-erythritol kinase